MNRFTKAVTSFGARLKAVGGMLFSGYGGQGWGNPWRGWSGWTGYSSRRHDYALEVGDGSGNSTVAACALWVARTYPEAPLRVLDKNGEEIPAHPQTQLLRRPNAYYSGPLLWMATLLDYTISGNAYWIKGRSGGGRPAELWFTPSWMMRPRWPADGSEFISHYEYTVNGRIARYDTADIVHLRFGLDPTTRCGVSPLASVLGEIFTDDEAARFTGALLRNLGIPGVVISPDAGGQMSPDEAEEAKDNFTRKFGGDRRGEPMVMEGPTRVTVMSFSPEQMDLKSLRRIPEERVAAVLGIPPGVVGLGAGLDRNTYSNYAEAREAAYEGNIIPTQRLHAAELDTQLLPDFGGDARGEQTAFDLSQVRVLQADQDKLYSRLNGAVRSGWLRVGEARKAANWEVLPEHDVYFVPPNVRIVPAGELNVPPEPIAPAPASANGNGHAPVSAADLATVA